MVRLEVPARIYERAIREMDFYHRPMWAVMDLVPGSKWRIHATPWEEAEVLWRAEDVLRALRDALRARRPKAR
jgi:uncharacterized protein (DUF2237 family)